MNFRELNSEPLLDKLLRFFHLDFKLKPLQIHHLMPDQYYLYDKYIRYISDPEEINSDTESQGI